MKLCFVEARKALIDDLPSSSTYRHEDELDLAVVIKVAAAAWLSGFRVLSLDHLVAQLAVSCRRRLITCCLLYTSDAADE